MAKIVYKQTTLERYACAGWLDFGLAANTALDRVCAGKRLYCDWYLSGLPVLSAVDQSKIKVDGGGGDTGEGSRLDHLQAYNEAAKTVPPEFWTVVYRVCIEDKSLKAEGSALQVKRELYAQKVDLCRGLDRLVAHYRKR